MTAVKQSAYLAPPGFGHLLQAELQDVTAVYGELFLATAEQQPAWVQNIWHDPISTSIDSIGHGVKILRGIQRSWSPYTFQCFRRMKLLEEQLPHISHKPLSFLAPIPSSPLGAFTLMDEKTMLYASHTESPLPNGLWHFQEDKINPPSRAYLKLWEFFTRLGVYPQKHEEVLDLGACPGGWTWVLASLAKKVTAFDRSPLDDTIMALKNVHFHALDAFKVKLCDYPKASWIFSDVICYPEKLYEFVNQLLKEAPDKKYVFTIKFQGDDHQAIIARFKELPGRIVHLSQNKHELTWFKI